MNDCLWITRAPETINLTKEIIAAIVPDLIKTPSKSSFRSLCTTYAGISQRWVVIYSPESRRRATKNINKNWLKQTTALQKSFQHLCNQNDNCPEGAEKVLYSFQKKQKLVEIIPEAIEKITRYKKSGRPGKDQPADYFDYQIRGSLMMLIEPRIQRIQRKSCYVLATNQLDSEQLSDSEVIALYKNQQKVERGFRFLKDPMFMSSNFFLKSLERVMVLTMIMMLCLLLYVALGYRIRKSLKQAEKTFPNQKGKGIANPTAHWVFQFFTGIYVWLLSGSQVLVLNMNNNHSSLLGLLGEKYEKLYSGSG